MGDGAGGLATRRFNRQGNGYRMRCKPPWTSTATTWFLVSPAGPSSLLTAGMSVPETAPGERSQVILGRSRIGCRLLPQQTDTTEGMLRALMVLSWVPHQMPRHGDRCSPVRRQSPSASSGGPWLPQTPIHPHTATPARRGRCPVELGAKRCDLAPRWRAVTPPCRC